MFINSTECMKKAHEYADAMGEPRVELEFFKCFHFPTQRYYYDFSLFGVGETIFWQEKQASRARWADIERL